MANKPVLAMAGAILSAVVMSGCESGRLFFDGPKSYTPAPMPASMTYAPSAPWHNQARPTAMTAQGGVYSATALKADGTPGPVEVTSSLQLVNGVNGVPTATPMLTITLPAVKFLVPINGSYSFTPPATGAGNVTAPADPLAAGHGAAGMGAASTDGGVLRAGTPSAPNPMPSAPPTIQYVVPTSPNAAPSIHYTVPQGQTAAPTIQYSAPQLPAPQAAPMLPPAAPMASSIVNQPAAAPKPADETVVTSKQPTLLTPPPPNWPKSTMESVDNGAPDIAVPPPPPPIHRHAAGGSGAAGQGPN
jgi:hypothetical protein